ncbi:MAG: hypothetical protein AB7L13_06210 [Acidimicrobiia bacterium]
MSALAHVFEACGLSTVALSLVRSQAVRGRAPRTLHCEFPFGRPLGRPLDVSFQRRVLDEAFALLRRTDVPVLVDFSETVSDQADEPLVCVLPPRHDNALHPAVDEAVGLRPAYERTHNRTHRTGVVRAGGPDRVPELIEVFVRIAAGHDWREAGIDSRLLGPAALDLRAYYEEAALALTDHVPGARQAEVWFYRSTATGKVLREARDAMRAAGAPRGAWFLLVPSPHDR